MGEEKILQPKSLSIIAKPTHNCNLRCKYCYMHTDIEEGFMSEKTLENMITKALAIHDVVHFIWHGGEPLLVPLDFYRRAIEIQSSYPQKKVTNGFQTNGTLVTDKIIEFCEKYNFNLGFSLDGPRDINNKTRYFRNGRSSFMRTLNGIKKAKEKKLGEGIIVVINKLNIENLLEIYEFANREGLNLKLNPLVKSGRATNHYPDLGILPHEYGQALVAIFDRWYNENTSTIKIDPFDELIGNLLTRRPWGCNYSTSCQTSFISISPQGEIYPCGRFEGISEFKLGNINYDVLADVLNSAKRRKLAERASRIESCKKCDYNNICNSGCMHNAYMQRGNIDDKDYYCASYKILFTHIKKVIDIELAKAEV